MKHRRRISRPCKRLPGEKRSPTPVADDRHANERYETGFLSCVFVCLLVSFFFFFFFLVCWPPMICFVCLRVAVFFCWLFATRFFDRFFLPHGYRVLPSFFLFFFGRDADRWELECVTTVTSTHHLSLCQFLFTVSFHIYFFFFFCGSPSSSRAPFLFFVCCFSSTFGRCVSPKALTLVGLHFDDVTPPASRRNEPKPAKTR